MTTPERFGIGPKDGWPYPSGEWRRVSPKYALVVLIGDLLSTVVIGAAWWFTHSVLEWRGPVLAGAFIAALVLSLVAALFAYRRTQSIGYTMREDDFLYRRGLLFERVIAVPYGRLQLVDIRRGPRLRLLGLANLKFVTASPHSDVELPGLNVGDAEALRDELLRVAETRRSGL